MIKLAHGWALHVDVGPEWLFLVLQRTDPAADPAPPLAEHAVQLARQHALFRLVVEVHSSVTLTSYLAGQLVLLHKRIHRLGGVVRICGFSTKDYQVLKIMQLDERFPNYRNREDAVMGRLP